MSDLRLYVDEDAGEIAVIRGLRARGLDILTAAEAGQLGKSDEEQLVFAVQEQRTLYSLNVGDFARLHAEYLATGSTHYGIVVIPDQRYSIGEKIRKLAALMVSVTSEEMTNRMEYL